MNFGPYEEISIEPFYFYVFKEEHKSYSTDLLKALMGVTYNTFKGLEKFKLNKQTKDNTKAIFVNDYSSKEIDKVIKEIKEHKSDNPIIISVTPQKEEHFYFEMKSKCLEENIPSQTVHIETINTSNMLKWSVGSIALQIFSKLSGVPWIVKQVKKIV